MNIFKYKNGIIVNENVITYWKDLSVKAFFFCNPISWGEPSVLTNIESVQYLEFPTNKLGSRLRVNFKRVGNLYLSVPALYLSN